MGGTGQHVDFDTILETIGGFGKWQAYNIFFLCFTSMAAGLAVIAFTFTGKIPDHRCRVPYCPDTIYNNTLFPANASVQGCVYKTVSSLIVPPDAPTEQTCQEYVERLENGIEDVIERKCNSTDLLFDWKTDVTSSVSVDNLWVCENNVIAGIVGSSYMVGMLIGSFVLGIASDRYGRMKALLISVVLLSAPPIIGAFVSDTYSFAFLRVLTGMGGMGCFMVTFVLSVEYVSIKYTLLIGVAIEIPFAIGELLLGIEAYFIRDWVRLQLVAYSPWILLILLWFVIPESPRWLIAEGRIEEAKRIVKRAIKFNGKTNLDVEELFRTEKRAGEEPLPAEKIATLIDLFTPKVILLRSLNMCYQWFSVTMCYYGLSFASTTLGGDTYTNFCLNVFIEIPAYIFCMLVMDSWGRRPILSFCQLTAGVSCILAGLLIESEDPILAGLKLFLSLLGKFGASACFAIVFLYTAELFPTAIRNTAIGTCSCVARFGGIFAILISLTSTVWVSLPMVLMGSVAVTAGVLAIYFPDTIGHHLPETMEEALKIGQDKKRSICQCTSPWWLKKKSTM